MATIDDSIDISEVIDKISEDYYQDLLIDACNLLSLAGTVHGDHYSPARILYDLLEGTSYDEVKQAMKSDYERTRR